MKIIEATNSNGDTVRLQIDGGTVRAIYDDALVDVLPKIGDVTITRASRVEPDQILGGWIADMSPVGGPILPDHDTGATFKTRAEALAAERDWLRAHKGL